MSENPFDYVTSILKTKKHLIDTSDDKEASEKNYNPFLTNRALSFYADSILYANEMNMHGDLDHHMQYSYFINNIRSMSRKHVWLKKQKDDDIDMVKNFFKVNHKKTLEIMAFLSDDDLKQIKKAIRTGGVSK